ncbi:MAG: hypothetical protein VKJ64_19905 [Leptolyngbyaceae bacterium]|nr:hypothetical protein [Leptolyngbyaceae bacterium]
MAAVNPPVALSPAQSTSAPSNPDRQGRQPSAQSSSTAHPANGPAARGMGVASMSDPEIKISSSELSKRALLHMIRKACGRDIEPLKHLALEDLQVLAANVVLPKEGVPVGIMPIMPRSA